MIKRGATKLRQEIQLCKECWKQILAIIAVMIFACFLFIWLDKVLPPLHHVPQQQQEVVTNGK